MSAGRFQLCPLLLRSSPQTFPKHDQRGGIGSIVFQGPIDGGDLADESHSGLQALGQSLANGIVDRRRATSAIGHKGFDPTGERSRGSERFSKGTEFEMGVTVDERRQESRIPEIRLPTGRGAVQGSDPAVFNFNDTVLDRGSIDRKDPASAKFHGSRHRDRFSAPE